MRNFGKQFFVGSGLAAAFLAATLAAEDEPKQLMMSGADVYRGRALQEIRRQKPEIDVAKLRYQTMSYSYDPPQPNSRWYESIQFKFADPATNKFASRGGFNTVTGTCVSVHFTRDPEHATEPVVQVQTETFYQVLNRTADPFGDDPRFSAPPSPSTKPATVP